MDLTSPSVGEGRRLTVGSGAGETKGFHAEGPFQEEWSCGVRLT